jgi:hypothetical protein
MPSSPPPTLEDEELTSSGEDIPMFFVRPQQLLDIFTHLEESNLFLIQNCQEIEQQLEELKQQYRDTERAIGKQTAGLDVGHRRFPVNCPHVAQRGCVTGQDTIRNLKDQIEAEEKKLSALRSRAKLGCVRLSPRSLRQTGVTILLQGFGNL